MTKGLSLQILTPNAVLLSTADVAWIQVTLTDGSLGIWPGHTALLAATVNAPLRYQDNSQAEHRLNLMGGVLQIKANTVTIFTPGLQSEAENQPAAPTQAGQFQRLTAALLATLNGEAEGAA